MIQIVAVLALCISSIHSHSYYPSFPLTPSVHQALPQFRTYYQPLNPFNPRFENNFGTPFYQPQIPPFFTELKPSNETTEIPTEQSTTAPEKIPEEHIISKPDDNDTVSTSALSFDDIFKKTIISPEFTFIPRQPAYISRTPVYPQFPTVPVPPSSSNEELINSDDGNFLVNHLQKINDAYGLPGFRPFYYDQFIRQLKASNCTESTKPCADDLLPHLKSEKDSTKSADKDNVDLIKVIHRMYKPDPNIVVFNTKDTPFLKAPEEPMTDDELDVRNGKSDDLYSKVYKDIMYLNKSYLSTVAPYLH